QLHLQIEAGGSQGVTVEFCAVVAHQHFEPTVARPRVLYSQVWHDGSSWFLWKKCMSDGAHDGQR
ncbi:hypothetical protein, partial [Pantoea sp. SIMBA_079]|uniref:hypothetical protein n=1 Tax=Pantoea sp. SIMBA_079 TaxID=3085817 RepID=UPI003992C9E8